MSGTVITSRKAHIMQVAQELFRQNGYAATSMRNLASELGIEAASICSHIRSKEEILQHICFEMADEFFGRLKDIIILDFPADEKLRRAICAHIEVITANIDASAVFFHDWRHLGGESLIRFKALRHEYEEMFRSIIREGMEEDIFRVADEKFVVLTVFSAMNWTYEWYKPESGMHYTTIGENIANILINGLKA